MARASGKYAVCVRNDGYPASLEPRKIYRVIRDAQAARERLIRVIDESGDDYLYPAEYFVPLAVSATVQRALRKAG